MTSLDKLTIETPEQTSLEFTLAGIGSRFLALAFDTLIQFIAGLALFIVFALMWSFTSLTAESGGVWIAAIAILVLFLLQFGYYTIFETIWNGQTPGKRYLHLRVIKESGRPINVYDAMARNLLRIVDSLPFIYGIGIISVLCSSRNKRLGDYVAGTVVVHEKPLDDVQSAWQGKPAPATATETLWWDVARISVEELQLIETFLQRRAHLDVEVRRRTAFEISARLVAKLEIPPEGRPSPEALLEMLAQQRRSVARYGAR